MAGTAPRCAGGELRRVEHHMSTAVTLSLRGVGEELTDPAAEALADRFFTRIAELESLLSRFRPQSQVSRLACGELAEDEADPAVREILARCRQLRRVTGGDFEHEPGRHGAGPALDVNGVAKGWIIDEAAMPIRMAGVAEWFVNAGGDIVTQRPSTARPWRVAVQHPAEQQAICGVLELHTGAVATSGTYERGEHLRGREPAVRSVTVVGDDLATADALATAAWASGSLRPRWWDEVARRNGLLVIGIDDRLRWWPPSDGIDVAFAPAGCAAA